MGTHKIAQAHTVEYRSRSGTWDRFFWAIALCGVYAGTYGKSHKCLPVTATGTLGYWHHALCRMQRGNSRETRSVLPYNWPWDCMERGWVLQSLGQCCINSSGLTDVSCFVCRWHPKVKGWHPVWKAAVLNHQMERLIENGRNRSVLLGWIADCFPSSDGRTEQWLKPICLGVWSLLMSH